MKNLLSLKKYFVKSSLSVFFSKTVAFTNFLPKMRESKFLQFPHYCVTLHFSLFHTVQFRLTHFWQKIRESNCFTRLTKEITK